MQRDAVRPAHLAVGTGAVVVVHNLVVAARLGEVAGTVANVVLAAAVLTLAARAGLDREELGWRFHRRGALVGLGSAAVVALVVWRLPIDAAPVAASARQVWFRVLVAIPIGTAVCEEAIFRGALLAAWDRVVPRRWSVVVTSLAFGLWHVAAEAQRTMLWSPAALVPGVVATAAASALVLCPLRRWTGDLVAPILLHGTTNVAVYLAVLQLT